MQALYMQILANGGLLIGKRILSHWLDWTRLACETGWLHLSIDCCDDLKLCVVAVDYAAVHLHDLYELQVSKHCPRQPTRSKRQQ